MPRSKTKYCTESIPVPSVSKDAFGYLNALRLVAMECRCKPRADLFEACALLQADRSAVFEAHAEALMRCLHEALGQPPRLHAPGTVEMTFDENWLVQLGSASARGDTASVSFLLASRVAAQHRRLLLYLVEQVSRAFFTTLE